MQVDGPIVSKQDYAAMRGRSPAAVSHWIAQGKLKAPALVGVGRSAKINVALADQQLSTVLDIGQQMAQAQPILPGATTEAPAATVPLVEDDQRLFLRAKREREELDLSVARAKAAELEGRWLDVQLAAEAWAGELGGIYRSIESWLLTVVPAEIAGLDKHDARSIGAHLKHGFRELRQRIADQAAEAKAEPPEEAVDEDDEDGAEED